MAAYLAAGNLEGGVQGERAPAHVLHAVSLCPSWGEREARLSAVQRLDCALLIDAHHDGVSRRVQVQPHGWPPLWPRTPGPDWRRSRQSGGAGAHAAATAAPRSSARPRGAWPCGDSTNACAAPAGASASRPKSGPLWPARCAWADRPGAHPRGHRPDARERRASNVGPSAAPTQPASRSLGRRHPRPRAGSPELCATAGLRWSRNGRSPQVSAAPLRTPSAA